MLEAVAICESFDSDASRCTNGEERTAFAGNHGSTSGNEASWLYHSSLLPIFESDIPLSLCRHRKNFLDTQVGSCWSPVEGAVATMTTTEIRPSAVGATSYQEKQLCLIESYNHRRPVMGKIGSLDRLGFHLEARGVDPEAIPSALLAPSSRGSGAGCQGTRIRRNRPNGSTLGRAPDLLFNYQRRLLHVQARTSLFVHEEFYARGICWYYPYHVVSNAVGGYYSPISLH